MKKSDFLERLGQAVRRLITEYNHKETDKKTFDWNRQSRYYAKVVNLFVAPVGESESDNPVALAIRRLARADGAFSAIDLETLMRIEEAWEYYEENERQRNFPSEQLLHG